MTWLPWHMLTGLREAGRARASLLAAAAVVAGICLPMLLLTGLSRGLVQQFREDLLSSPTTRRIAVWATRDDLRFDAAAERELQQRADIAVVLPDISARSWFSRGDGDDEPLLLEMSATKPGDPMLAFHGVTIDNDPTGGGPVVVLTTSAADRLGVAFQRIDERHGAITGDATVTMTVQRPGEEVKHRVDVRVVGVIPDDTARAIMSRGVMDQLESFKRGRPVPALNLPGAEQTVRPRYDGYLLFAKQPLTDRDRDELRRRGLAARLLDAENTDDAQARVLFGLLRPHDFHVYLLTATLGAGGAGKTVDLDPFDVETITDADDVAAPWTRPAVRTVNGKPTTVVGVSLRRRWLRPHFVAYHERMSLTVEADEQTQWTGLWFGSMDDDAGTHAPIALRDDQHLQLEIESLEPEHREAAERPETALPVLIVDAALAAHLARLDAGMLDFDEIAQRFIAPATPNRYAQGFIYAATIDDVPELNAWLQSRGYSTISAASRVMEMRQYVGTLDLLVRIVLIGAAVLGAFTMTVVFWDITHRKRGVVGVLRLCGMSPAGVLTVMLMRGLLVGAVGAAVTLALGEAFVHLLRTAFNADCRLTAMDRAHIALAAGGCAMLGVLLPALHAALRASPVDALTGARVQ